MKNPALAAAIVEKTVKAIRKPVTVKIRKGFDDAHVNAVEVAKAAESAGAAAVAVHGRTREQFYAGKADWEIIAKVKQAVKIPVIGNGDVADGEAALRIMEETGCDGVMVGRAARGNPWIFREIKEYLQEGAVRRHPSKEEKKAMVLRHASLLLEYKGEYTGIREMRKHVSWYIAGYPNSARIRGRVNEMESMDDLRESIEEIFG